MNEDIEGRSKVVVRRYGDRPLGKPPYRLRRLLGASARTSDSDRGVQMRVLLVIDRDGPVNLSTLAARLALSIPSTSRLVDRLVEAGLITRTLGAQPSRTVARDHPARRRRVLTRLRRARRQAIAAALERMTRDDRRALSRGPLAVTRAATS